LTVQHDRFVEYFDRQRDAPEISVPGCYIPGVSQSIHGESLSVLEGVRRIIPDPSGTARERVAAAAGIDRAIKNSFL
jgi:hypothetical protein